MDIAAGAIGSILSKLVDLLKSEYNLQTGVKEQVESLTKELKTAQVFLQKIDKVPPDQLDDQVKIYASEVREASYDMEDILDSFLVRVERPAQPINKKKRFFEMLQKIGSSFSKAKARHDINTAIEQVNNRVRTIAERRQRYRLNDCVVSVAAPSSQIDPRIALVHRTNTSLLIGIDERKDAIIKMLSQDGDMSAKKTKIVSLLGFGGIGKTTLAKATYDQLKQEYECAAFVSVGQKPNLEKVLKGILYYIDKEKLEKINSTKVGADVLIPELLDYLKDKRYLIVIDDVWETQSRKRILDALAHNIFGSIIIITTRKSEVAIGEVYKVKPLSGDNSIRLFYTRIFGAEDNCPENQREKVSKVEDKILKKCGGVPLAIITMASYLVGKSMEEWIEVCNSIGFCGKDKEQTGETEWILSLSYYDLPSHLKTCLLYLSLIPEDYLVSKDVLIWMWIGEGFVDNGKSGDGLFEIGEGYFNELINRSLIQPVEEASSMIVKGCRVHDMILDLIRSLSRETNFAIVLDSGEDISIGSNARRFALQNRGVKDTPQGNCMNTKQVRSFITFSCSFSPRVQLQSFKFLRMLYLEDCNGVQIDEHVGDLHHLRCLGIHGRYDGYELPKEIGALKFLRVLCLGHWPIGGLLPSSVGMLTQLVCLYAPGMDLLGCTIKDLMSLQELRIHNLMDDSMSKGQFVNDLGNLSELRVLMINCSNMDMRMKSDLLTSVGNLHKLQHLDMINGFNVGLPSCIHPLHLPRLSHLSLQLDSLSDEDLEILGGLPELCYLRVATLEGRASLTGTESRGYFMKLRSCLLPESMVQFAVNEDMSVSFTIWHESADAPNFGSKRKQEKVRVVQAVMPKLGALSFGVNVAKLTACNNGSCDNLGLEYLACLQKVTLASMDIATGAIGSILPKLADLLELEYMRQTGVKDQIGSLTKELTAAKAFIQMFDQVPPDQLDEQVRIYTSEVREASYDMEDILDTFLVRVKGPDTTKKDKKKLIERLQEKMATLFSKTAARHHIAGAIADIMKRLQEAKERRGRYEVDSFISRPSPSSVVDPRLAFMYKHVTKLIGIEKSRAELASLLSSQLGNEMSDNKLKKIVSVVGVGGLGKTTLAKAVYEDLKGQFSCCAFVPVGRDPDLKKVLRDILIELNKHKYADTKYTVLDERQLIDELRVVLEGKRYFIVIDDVWDSQSWEWINLAMVENNNGSRIIITTRKSEVATGAVYRLLPLSVDNSKRLFYTRIFGGEDKYHENQQQKVPEVAEKILKKCGGIPLAIITMASYLVGKSMEEWLEVCHSIGFCGKDKEETHATEWILSLSYYDLPSHLKTCLLYLSIFPEDHLISKNALIWMWIAEGFVFNNEKTGAAGPFEIGERYFNELINRSLTQPVEDEISMIVEGCRVHDMILDLIRSLSREANFAMVSDSGDGTSIGSNVPRRLALQNRMTEDTPQGNCMDTTRARSLLAFSCRFVPEIQLERFKILRVLYLDGCECTGFDKHVGDLHHLRCLGIVRVRQSTRLELPKEIGELKFLRVLYLDNAPSSLPSSVGMLTQLVCLYAPNMYLPGCTIKELRSLQVLRINSFEDDDVSKKGQFVKDLCHLSELRELVVRNCGIMGDIMESELSTSIGNLRKLQHLDVRDYLGGGLPSCIHPSHLPRLFHLFLNLSSLSDKGLEILGGFPHLSYLGLYIDGGRTTLTGPADRYFQKLRYCLLPRSMVHFAVNEDSSVSFTIWHRSNDAPAFGSKRVKQDKCRAARGAIMPKLEALSFRVNVQELTACNNGSCDNLGLEYLASLQKVTVLNGSSPDAGADVEQQKAVLRHTIEVHPNRPHTQTRRWGTYYLTGAYTCSYRLVLSIQSSIDIINSLSLTLLIISSFQIGKR
ncbi:hypothetical protein U9M48_001129 [Paspalum notatum var. saurae]|uniref:Uncharacterized protein n=1 Tax=Paspalum notatum var. saurae TaxID=547442 RepID=A0AAQ3SIP0_PASNO